MIFHPICVNELQIYGLRDGSNGFLASSFALFQSYNGTKASTRR